MSKVLTDLLSFHLLASEPQVFLMRRNGRAFSHGVDLRGPLALSVTQREGGAKPPRRPCPLRISGLQELDVFFPVAD